MAKDDTTRSNDEPTLSDALAKNSAELDAALSSGSSSFAGYIPANDPDDAEALAEADTSAAADDLAVVEAAEGDDAGLPGEELAGDLADPKPFLVMDDEAEELDGVDVDAITEPAVEPLVDDEVSLEEILDDEISDDPADVLIDDETGEVIEATQAMDLAELGEPQIDDPEQLADAEAVAVAATSTRPTRRPKKKAALAKADKVADTDEADAAANDDLADGADVPVTTRPARKTASTTAPTRKATKTPSRKEATATTGARSFPNPVRFVRESVAELRKVVWPTGAQVRQYFVVVLVFVLFIIVFVGLLDFGLGWALLKLLG